MKSNYPTVLILLNQNEKESGFIREWFKRSRFQTSEADNIFDAVEIIGDFTTNFRPQVILLKADLLTTDFPNIRAISQSFFAEGEISFMALCGSRKVINDKDCFEGNLTEIALKINNIMPQTASIGLAA